MLMHIAILSRERRSFTDTLKPALFNAHRLQLILIDPALFSGQAFQPLSLNLAINPRIRGIAVPGIFAFRKSEHDFGKGQFARLTHEKIICHFFSLILFVSQNAHFRITAGHYLYHSATRKMSIPSFSDLCDRK